MIKCFKDSIFVVIFFVMESKCCGFSVLEFQCGVLRFFCLLTFPFIQILNASLLMIPFGICHIPSFFGPSKYDLKE